MRSAQAGNVSMSLSTSGSCISTFSSQTAADLHVKLDAADSSRPLVLTKEVHADPRHTVYVFEPGLTVHQTERPEDRQSMVHQGCVCTAKMSAQGPCSQRAAIPIQFTTCCICNWSYRRLQRCSDIAQQSSSPSPSHLLHQLPCCKQASLCQCQRHMLPSGQAETRTSKQWPCLCLQAGQLAWQHIWKAVQQIWTLQMRIWEANALV